MVMVREALMVIERAFVAVPMPSATWAVKLAVPAVVGVPPIAPLAELSDNPVGSVPVVMDQV